MVNSMLLRKAVADVTQRKGRTFLMILGILVSVLGLTAVNVASDQLSEAFAFDYSLGTLPDIVVNTSPLPDSFASSVAALPNISQIQIRQEFRTTWHPAGTTPVSMQINAFASFEQIEFRRFEILEGRAPGVGEIVMDVRNGGISPVAVGDIVSLKQQDGNVVSLQVVGLARTAARSFQNDSLVTTAYMSSDGLEQIAPGGVPSLEYPPPRSSTIFVKTSDDTAAEQTLQAIEDSSKAAGYTIIDGDVEDVARVNDSQNGVQTLLLIIRVLSYVALVLTCMLILNMITTLLTEQVKIIGTMKAIGGTRWRIIGSYLFSIGIYGFAGTILGILPGVYAGSLLAQIFAEAANSGLGPFRLTPQAILISALVGFLIPLLSALFPLWEGTRITVREAISTHGIGIGNRQPRAWGRALSWLPQTIGLGLRSIVRKPGRTLLTLSALTFSAAVFMGVQITNTSVGLTLDAQAKVYHNDLEVFLGLDPISVKPALETVQSLPGIEHIEAQDEISVTTAKGNLRLVGLAAETEFYQPQLVSGRWLLPADTNALVLSDFAARRLSLRMGDTITLLIGTQPVSWYIVGIVHDLNYASNSTAPDAPIGAAFLNLKYLNAVRNAPEDAAKNLLIRTQDSSIEVVRAMNQRIIEALHAAGIHRFRTHVTQLTAENQQQNLSLLYVLFSVVAILVALVGVLSLANMLSASVLERQREIGILRSLGATSWRVGTVFWVEGTVLAIIAWGLGVLLGFPGATLLLYVLGSSIMPFDFYFTPLLIPLSLLFIVVIACLASFGPALRAARMRIQEVISYE